MAGVLSVDCRNGLLSFLLKNQAWGAAGNYLDSLAMQYTTGEKTLANLDGHFAPPVGGAIAVTGTPVLTSSSPTGSLVSVSCKGPSGAGNPVVVSDLVAALDTSAEIQVDNLAAAGTTNLLKFAIKLAKVNGTMQFSEALRNYLLLALISQGTQNNAFTFSIYSGAAPSDIESPATGTLLWQYSPNTSEWTVLGGQGTFGMVTGWAASAAGAPGYARIAFGSTDAKRLQGSCGNAGNFDFVTDKAAWAQGELVKVTQFVLRVA